MPRTRTTRLVHLAGTSFAATTGTGRTFTFGDDAAANEQSPVELVVATLAGCSGMDVIGILEKKRQVLTSYAVEVTAEQRDDYPQVLVRAEVTHVVEGTVLVEAAVRRAVELSATKYCPVSAMLSAGATEIHHRYRMRCTGAVPTEGEGLVVVTGPYKRPDVVAVKQPDPGGAG